MKANYLVIMNIKIDQQSTAFNGDRGYDKWTEEDCVGVFDIG